MKKNPLTRAIRIDKFTIAALEETLKLYLDEEVAINSIPTIKMATMGMQKLEEKSDELFKLITELDIAAKIEIVDQVSQIGGGAMPMSELPTKAIEIRPENMNVALLEKRLRNYKNPIITRVYKNTLLLDVRTISESEYKIVVEALETVFKKESSYE